MADGTGLETSWPRRLCVPLWRGTEFLGVGACLLGASSSLSPTGVVYGVYRVLDGAYDDWDVYYERGRKPK